MVEWRDVSGYPGYYVSDMGQVRGARGVLSPNICGAERGKYMLVHLYRGGMRKAFLIHRLVCTAFHPLVEGKKEVDHINMDKLDNRAINLRWESRLGQMNNTKMLTNTGHKHISLTKNNTYRVSLKRNGVHLINNTYKTLNDAITARDNFLSSL